MASTSPAEPPQTARRPPRILVLSASIGEGHDLPARVLADGVLRHDTSAVVEVVDGLRWMGRTVNLLVRDNAQVVVRRWPWVYDVQFAAITRWRPTRIAATWLGNRLAAEPLLAAVQRWDPDVVVSTYPGVTEVLGRLRDRGRLRVPLVSAITDLAALRYWARPGVDEHLVIHRESIPEVDHWARRPGRARWVQGLTAPAFLRPPARDDARRALGLPLAGSVVVVSGGGWAVGDLEGAIEAVLSIPGATVVALAGRSDEVRDALSHAHAAEPRVRVLGFTDRMCELLSAADAIVHSTAGLTVLEALMCGCAPISYGWGVGHVAINNEAYRAHGLARVAADRGELDAALREALAVPRAPDGSYADLPEAASVVLALAGR